MVEVADRVVEAAWKMRNLEDYDARLERAARQVDEEHGHRNVAALVIYETALVKSGHSTSEVRELVRNFRERWEGEEDHLTIPRVSGIMNTEGEEWFFGNDDLRVMTGRLLGQFQHRVAQYNYVSESEVLKRWADSHDTRLFIRRRIHETEPVAGVVPGFDLPLLQRLRVAAGGDTLVPTEEVSRALAALGFDPGDEYDTLSHAENLALHLDLPAPIVGEMLEDIARENKTDFPEPPSDLTGAVESEEPEERVEQPSAGDREARVSARKDPKKGEEPTRVQDPQATEAPGAGEETGTESPASPETSKEDAPGTSDGNDENS